MWSELPDALLRERDALRRKPRGRPAQIEEAGAGRESVWDYPRPPRIETERRVLRVEFAGTLVARSTRALRVCETASPPTYYVPQADLLAAALRPGSAQSFCEWKGVARYHDLVVGEKRSRAAAWCYPEPFEDFALLRDCFAFYPARVDACWLGEERVRAQPGGFYGGWVTAEIAGPFKGEPGSEGW